MKLADLKQMSQEELASKLYSCKEELGKLNYQKRIGQVDKPHRFKELRRTIARIHTLSKGQHSEPAKKNLAPEDAPQAHGAKSHRGKDKL